MSPSLMLRFYKIIKHKPLDLDESNYSQKFYKKMLYYNIVIKKKKIKSLNKNKSYLICQVLR